MIPLSSFLRRKSILFSKLTTVNAFRSSGGITISSSKNNHNNHNHNRSYMSVRERPSHSGMFGEDGKIIPMKEPPSDGNGWKMFGLACCCFGTLVYYYKTSSSAHAQEDNEKHEQR